MKKYVDRIFGQKSFRPFVVICHPRTGSNLLLSYLDNHPNIKAKGEIFKKLDGESIRDVYQAYMRREPAAIMAKGFKVFYTHPEDGEHEELLQLLDGIPEILIIHLTRTRKLATLLSWMIAQQIDVWGLRTDDADIPLEKRKIHIDPSIALTFLGEIQHDEQRIAQRYSQGNYLHVTFEKLIQDPADCMQAICNRLRVPYITMKTKYKRMNPEDPAMLIRNYEELERTGVVSKLNEG